MHVFLHVKFIAINVQCIAFLVESLLKKQDICLYGFDKTALLANASLLSAQALALNKALKSMQAIEACKQVKTLVDNYAIFIPN